MNKIYMKDIRNICSCISGLSCQTVRNNKKGLNNWIELYNNDRFKNKREKSYVDISRVLPNKSYGEIAKFSFKELAAKLKAKQIEEKDGAKLIELNSDSYKCCFDADNLKKISDILGTTNLVIRLYGELKPALIIDEKNDNQAIIVPVRKYC